MKKWMLPFSVIFSMNKLIILTLFLTSLVYTCELEHHSNTVKLSISSGGLHRRLFISTNLISNVRFLQCRLLYKLIIPSTIFIDDYALNRTINSHDYINYKNFNVEEIAKNSKPTEVYFIRKNKYFSTFEITDQLSLDIHIRYPPAGRFKEYHHILFPNPFVAVDCENNQFSNCQNLSVHLGNAPTKVWKNVPVAQENVSFMLRGSDYEETDLEIKLCFGALILACISSIMLHLV